MEHLPNTMEPENVSGVAFNTSYLPGYPSTLDPIMDIVIGSYLILCMILSMILNSVVLMTMARRKRTISSLEYYIIFLSLTDLVQTACGFPMVIIACFQHGWFLGDEACDVEAALVFFCGCATINTLATMSVMRYIKTCHAQIGLNLTLPVVMMTLFLVCLLSGMWSLGPLLGWGEYAVEPFGLSCALDWNHLNTVYTWNIFTWCFSVPVLVMVCSYSRMVITIHNALKGNTFTNNRMDLYLSKMSACMCGCFLLAWSPYAVVALMYVFGAASYVPDVLAVAAPILAKSSTWYNPLIYFLAVKRFRDDLYECARCGELPMELEMDKELSSHIPMLDSEDEPHPYPGCHNVETKFQHQSGRAIQTGCAQLAKDARA